MRVGDRAVAVVGMGSPIKRGAATRSRTRRSICVYDRAGSVGHVGVTKKETLGCLTPWRMRAADRAVAVVGVGLASGQARRGHQ